jgi:methylenetetrahydrofolate dehydrogenase (NADP+)/methenyltetrahydrofolate cyclohydrolase
VSARLLDGRALAERVQADLAERVAALEGPPGLAVILVGDDPASRVYVRRKGVVAHQLGLVHRQIDLPAHTSEHELVAVVRQLNADPAIHGILVQLPLPRGLDASVVLDAIDPSKDVDGISAANLGLLVQGRPGLVACTPKGCLRLLVDAGVPLAGRRAVVVGRSTIVGRPLALLLEQANATVTVAHSRTVDLGAVLREADVVVAAVGRPGLVRGEHLRPGAVVVDVGINRTADGKLVGDVDFASAAEVASAITPVPGGVGPMTIAMLMENTVEAATRRA